MNDLLELDMVRPSGVLGSQVNQIGYKTEQQTSFLLSFTPDLHIGISIVGWREVSTKSSPDKTKVPGSRPGSPTLIAVLSYDNTLFVYKTML
jgi:hypothetical protein